MAMHPRRGSGATSPGETVTANTDGGERTRELHSPPRLHAAQSPPQHCARTFCQPGHQRVTERPRSGLELPSLLPRLVFCPIKAGGKLLWQRGQTHLLALPAHRPARLWLASGELLAEGTGRWAPDRSRPLAIVICSGVACDSEWADQNPPDV